jgi:iron complex outermembrane receptor protein
MTMKMGAFLRFMASALLIMIPLSSSAQPNAPASPAPVGEEMILFQEIPSVYGASKYEQKVTEAPSSVSIITSSEIRKHGYRTLADILRSVTGFYITYDRNYSYIGVRGFGRPSDYNSRILLLIDGHRTNDNVYDSALIGTEGLLDVDLIDRVEVIRGPGSSLYGSNAFFGVVNIITRRGRNLKGTEVSGEAASYTTSKGRLSYGNRFQNGVEAFISGTGYDSKGDNLYYPEYDSPATNNGVADHTDYDRSQSLFTNEAFGNFTLQGVYSSRTKGIPTGAFGTDFNNTANKTVDTRSYGDLKYEHSVGAKTDLTARLYYDYYKYWGDYAYYTDPAIGALNRDVTYGSWWGGELKLNTRFGDMHRLIVGAEFQDNLRQDQANYNVDPPASYLDDVQRSSLWASYLQDEITFSPAIMLNAGVRYDHYSTFGGTANPRLALIFSPAEKSTIKLLYGSAFRAPNVYELHYFYPGFSLPNPNLNPEKIKTAEAVFEQYLGDHFRASLSGYHYTITDLINYDLDADSGLLIFRNLEKVTATGGELELDGKWESGLEARMSCVVQRTKDQATGDPLSNSPEDLATVALTIPLLPDRIFAGIDERFTGRRKTVTGEYVPGFFITNLTLFSQNIVRSLDASVSVYNVFDKEYGDPVTLDFAQKTIQQDGRSYRVKLTYAF